MNENNINGGVPTQPVQPNVTPTPQPTYVNQQPVENVNPIQQDMSSVVSNPQPVQQNVSPMSQSTFVNSQPVENIVPTQPVQPTVAPTPQPVENMNTVASINQTVSEQSTQTDPIAAVANLNKEEAMEDALSHTTQYSPFEAPKQEVNQDVKKKSNNKSVYIFISIIFVIMLLFIIFLPQISKLFGW